MTKSSTHNNVIDPMQFGVSFSVKQCRNFGLNSAETLQWLLHDAGFRRFRLMSYWNECERDRGKLDFKELDRQIDAIERAGGIVSLCLGVRQPRWPENHWPEWAWHLPKSERSTAVLNFVEQVAIRYASRACIVSFQLENEALLKAFGKNSDVDRPRLRAEYQLVKKLVGTKLVIMSTSNSWGIPVRRPIPDVVGFSYYNTQYRNGAYHHSNFFPVLHRLRKYLIYALHRRPVFVHELQLEPWGPTAIWKMDNAEQDRSMSPQHIARSIRLARKINVAPLDLWGAEWWYWRLKVGADPAIWESVRAALLHEQ